MLITEIDISCYENSLFENAATMVDMCRSEYAQCGLMDAAISLRGAEVSNYATAKLALLLVLELPETPEVEIIKAATLESLLAVATQSRNSA